MSGNILLVKINVICFLRMEIDYMTIKLQSGVKLQFFWENFDVYGDKWLILWELN